VLHQIGNGALGPVFRAYDSERDRLVAIKVFKLDLSPDRVHQIVGELEQLIAAELQHPVIAAPRAAGIDANSNAFLAQDFAAADSLDIVLRESGRSPIAATLRVASQLADALDYAADRQVLHGALHPRDILLSEDDIRIVGIGVARALERAGVTTPVRRPYSAPERINDEGWDRRADVFSLAAIVYELLCGRRVTGIGSEAAESMTDVPGCDVAALQGVFALALAADPNYRYETAAAFTDALKAAAAPDTDSADMAADGTARTARPRRSRTKLRVVTSPDESSEAREPEEDNPPAPDIEPFILRQEEEPPLPLITFADELQKQLAGEPPPKVRLPRRRKVPAPTPVAIETVASADLLLTPEPVSELPSEPLDLIAVPEVPAPPELPVDDASGKIEAVVSEEPVVHAPLVETPPAEAPLVSEELAAFEPEPVIEPTRPFEERLFEEPLFEEPLIEERPFEEPPLQHTLVAERIPEPRLPPFLEPPVPPIDPAPAHSPIWPIGVAAIIGLAVGFGVGYTIAIRDRAVTAPAAAISQPAPAATKPAADVQLPKTPPPAAAPARTVEAAPAKPQPSERAASPFVGRVMVRSTPPGARIFVDGKDRGQTPAIVRDLSQGEHRIRVVRDGYTSAERRVVLTPDDPLQSLSVPLAREPRTRSLGDQPVSPKLGANQAAKAGKPSESQSAKAETGSVNIESRPSGATVYLDGRAVGTTPMNIGDVRAGTHSVRLERDGYKTWSASADIKGGEQNRVTASLEK
jgi:serine/threonine protein kinase